MTKACYRELHRYKYQLVEDYELDVGIPDHDVDHAFLRLTPTGRLTIRDRYAWDGPSWSVDTLTFMRGALVHDALYQLMRMEELEQSYRRHADDLLREICLEDGMSSFRAWYVHRAVVAFGESHALPSDSDQTEVICVPQ